MKPPSSVVHYTSLDVLSTILNKALENGSDAITLHLSHLTKMNDSGEGRFVWDRFFTDYFKKQNLKSSWEEYYLSHMPFVLSTIATDNISKNNGSIPMWRMYGNEFKGALIRFNGEKLTAYCTEKGYRFESCDYRTITDVGKIIKGLNKISPKANNLLEYFDEIMRRSCFIKNICWNYEKEWRILAFAETAAVKTKQTLRGLVEYIELDIPIDLIEEICIGPLCNEDISMSSLELLTSKLQSVHNDKVHFKISKSKLPIR